MKKIFFVFALFLLLAPAVIKADLVPCGNTPDNPCTLCNLIGMGTGDTQCNGQKGIIKIVIDFILTDIVPTLAVIFLIIGGALLLMSAGSPERKTTGRNIIVATVIGTALAFGAGAIVSFVIWVLKGQ